MASASQLKALVQSYLEGDDDRFLSVAMQVAAHEARLGHGKLATELRETIDEAKRRRGAASLVSISKPRRGTREPPSGLSAEGETERPDPRSNPVQPDCTSDPGAAQGNQHPGAGALAKAQAAVGRSAGHR